MKGDWMRSIISKAFGVVKYYKNKSCSEKARSPAWECPKEEDESFVLGKGDVEMEVPLARNLEV